MCKKALLHVRVRVRARVRVRVRVKVRVRVRVRVRDVLEGGLHRDRALGAQ